MIVKSRALPNDGDQQTQLFKADDVFTVQKLLVKVA